MLPVGFLRGYEVFSSGVCILLGLFGMIYFPVLLQNNYNPNIDNDTRAGIVWGLFSTCLALELSSILFIIGRMKKLGFLVVLYNIMVIGSMLAFLILASVSSVVPFHIMNNTCFPGMVGTPSWSQQLEAVDTIANQTFCQQPCPCTINATAFTSYPASLQTQMYAMLPYMSIYSNSYSPNVLSCANIWSNLTESQKQSAIFLNQLESQFSCAGWCTPDVTYMFTSVTATFKKPPSSTCQEALVRFYRRWSKKCMITSWILFGIMLLNSVMIFCKMCHPSKRQGSIYQRLAG